MFILSVLEKVFHLAEVGLELTMQLRSISTKHVAKLLFKLFLNLFIIKWCSISTQETEKYSIENKI